MLGELIPLPDVGMMHIARNDEDILIIVWDYTGYAKQCSAVTDDQFSHVKTLRDY